MELSGPIVQLAVLIVVAAASWPIMVTTHKLYKMHRRLRARRRMRECIIDISTRLAAPAVILRWGRTKSLS